jgi:hypothetical protein
VFHTPIYDAERVKEWLMVASATIRTIRYCRPLMGPGMTASR